MFRLKATMSCSSTVTMKKSLPPVKSQSSESDSGGVDQVYNQSIIVPPTAMSIADGFEKNDHSWYNLNQP